MRPNRKFKTPCSLKNGKWCPRACQLSTCADCYPTIVLRSRTTFTKFKKGLTGLTNRNCTISYTPEFSFHNPRRTVSAPAPHPPTLRSICHLRSADLQPRSPLWPPALICRGALHSATPDYARPANAADSFDFFLTHSDEHLV